MKRRVHENGWEISIPDSSTCREINGKRTTDVLMVRGHVIQRLTTACGERKASSDYLPIRASIVQDQGPMQHSGPVPHRQQRRLSFRYKSEKKYKEELSALTTKVQRCNTVAELTKMYQKVQEIMLVP